MAILARILQNGTYLTGKTTPVPFHRIPAASRRYFLTEMRPQARLAETYGEAQLKAVALTNPAYLAIARECFELFHSLSTGLAKLSIETSNDLFEMDKRVTPEEVYEFRSKRGEWLAAFGAGLRDLFEKRIAGTRRKGRRPDPLQVFDSLRVVSDIDASKQSALESVSGRLSVAAKPEIDALEWRMSVLFGESPGRDVSNPFGPAYLLDAIGMTSRSIYPEARVWKPLMERVVSDFIPAINKTYLQLNRLLAQRRVLPEIGAVLRARSDLRPADDGSLLPLFGELINDVHPSFQAWRTLDLSAAATASYRLTPLESNPYVAATARVPASAAKSRGSFPELNAMMISGTLSSVMEALDNWQRNDPLDEYLLTNPIPGIDPATTPINRIPWIHAATASQIVEENNRCLMDVVGFVFDYLFNDPAIPASFKKLLEGLQVPFLKAALLDPTIFADKQNPARRLLDELAAAATCAHDDEPYAESYAKYAAKIVTAIRAEFVMDLDIFAYACEMLGKFSDQWQQRTAQTMQPQVDVGLATETRDADRSRVRVLIRDKLSGISVPFDIRTFIGTVWADYMTRLRVAEGVKSNGYIASVKVMDDMLWSIAAKRRAGQKARLATMIPPMVRGLRAGAAAVEVSEEKMECFLGVLYNLHMAAINPAEVKAAPARQISRLSRNSSEPKQIENLHDFVADLVLGTWLAFDQNGTVVDLRLSWISPWRATYIFTNRSASTLKVFTPEELAWEMSTGRVTLLQEPVPLMERAMSATLEYLAGQKIRQNTATNEAVERAPQQTVHDAVEART